MEDVGVYVVDLSSGCGEDVCLKVEFFICCYLKEEGIKGEVCIIVFGGYVVM